MDKVPILLYHDLCSETDKPKDNFTVTWNNFKQQMDFLHKNGFLVISLERMMLEGQAYLERGAPGAQRKDTRRRVVLTFDDGDVSNYKTVFPILRGLGFSATFFVTVNEIGKIEKMDWAMIYELSKSGMEIGSHGMNHVFLTARSDFVLLNELLMSKQILEKYTRKRVDALSIPRGFYSKRVLRIAKDVGFRAVCTSDAGYNDFLKKDLFLLKRFTMRRKYALNTFKGIVRQRPSWAVFALEGLRSVLRRALGYKVYDWLRSSRFKIIVKRFSEKG